ncbi:unnamed protein product [Triticum turgidum subsp. durum]|uniref:Uncharacterized protein n=2 Tax=Triticum TaxID=4564 RepID=A0A9R1BZH4_TRITD|nr:unnamed protein product [Triticum turgidum subsp. durum]
MPQDEVPESSSPSSAAAGRLNAAAPEFTPRSAAPHQAHPHRRGPHHHHHHHHQPHHQHQHQYRHQHHHQGEDEGDAAAVVDNAQLVLPEELARRVVKQVEFYFSDVNLATTDHLMKYITKDPDGFVPMTVVASFRKIRELIDRSLLPGALRTSTELVVSDDGKMVRRRVPFSDVDAEEVQSRIIVAEKLPEDHRYQNLMRIFSTVGSVKSIRTCYPQGIDISAGKSSRIEMLFANKLHAFVEYGTVEDAEKAVAEFSGGRNWRDGPRVRSLLGCLKHGIGQGRKGGDEEAADEDDPEEYEAEDAAQGEDGFYDKAGMRQGRGRGRGGRGRGRGQYHGQSRDGGHPIGTPPSNHSAEHPVVSKPPPGPRMPDGTKGFAMGRGKPQVSPAVLSDV